MKKKSKRKERRKRVHSFLRIIFWGGTLSFLAYVFLFGDSGYLARKRLSDEIGLLEKEITLLEEQNRNLELEIEALRNDPQIIERIARERLGLAREGEIKYKFVPQDSSSP